jgi:hypothetical protein
LHHVTLHSQHFLNELYDTPPHNVTAKHDIQNKKVKFATGLLIFVTKDVAATCTPPFHTFFCLEVGNLPCFTYHLQLSTPKTGQDVATFDCHFPSAHLVAVLFPEPQPLPVLLKDTITAQRTQKPTNEKLNL